MVKIYDETILVNTDDIVPYTKNHKIHTQKQIDLLCKNIVKFGFSVPIEIDENNVVLAGHGRLMAAHKLKLKQVPCIIHKGLSEAEKKAKRISDNRLAELGKIDKSVMMEEIKDIHISDLDTELTGFTISELDRELSSIQNITPVNDMDEIKKEIEEESNVEKVDKLGSHVITCPKCFHQFQKS